MWVASLGRKNVEKGNVSVKAKFRIPIPWGEREMEVFGVGRSSRVDVGMGGDVSICDNCLNWKYSFHPLFYNCNTFQIVKNNSKGESYLNFHPFLKYIQHCHIKNAELEKISMRHDVQKVKELPLWPWRCWE